MSLTFFHVVFVVITTTVGASTGRYMRNRSRRLMWLNEWTRGIAFLAGTAVVVWYLAGTHAGGIQKAGLAGLYIGLVYGLVASDPKPRRENSQNTDREKPH